MKYSFFQAAVMSKLLYGCTIWTLTKRLEKLDSNYTRMLRAKLSRLDEPDMQDIAGEAGTSS